MSEARRKAPTRARAKKHWALRVMGWLLALCFLGVIGAVATFFIGYQTTEIPDPNKEFAANTTTVYYSDGKTVLGTFYDQNRRSVPLEQIPKYVQDAMIAAEDRTFWTNPGISPSGMARAAFNIARGKQLQGGSTITQQYVKIMYLTQERTFSRKFSELFIATKLSRTQDKKEILEGYLNTIYFGEGAYGVAAAGEAYFSKTDPKTLSIPEAALLATVLNNPTRFDPDDKSAHKRILDRYRYVIDGMRQSGTISEAKAAQYSAKLPPLKKKEKSSRYQGPSGYLLDMARRELAKLVPEDQISGGGLRVVTTFDVDLQKAIVKAGQEELPKKNRANLHVGLASVRPGTGQLVAMYGGPDYLKSQLNWATLKARPGSSFKPFAVAAALLEKRGIYEVYQGDSPIEVQGKKLNNEFDRDYGDVNLLEATEESINTAFYDLIDKQMEDGPAKLVNAAEAAGIPKTKELERGRENPSTVLGPDPYASAVDMASAYATFAASGKYVPVHTLMSVSGPNFKPWTDQNKIIKTQAKQAFPPDVANMVNYVLQNVVEEGTGDGAKELGRPAAGKTGTAGGVAFEHRKKNAECDGCLDGKDTLTSWWAGYTPQLSTAVVYRAGKLGESDLDPFSDDPAFFGGNWPVKTWLAFMEPAHEGLPEQEFPEPNEEEVKASPTPTPTYTPTPTLTPPPSSTPPPPSSPPPSSTPPPSSNTPKPPKPSNTPTKTKPTKPTFPTIPTGPPSTGTTPPPEESNEE
ncbi:transglycosylase domain-containing protein [Kribbella sp. CA-294648]|uniref:transglycosylase domain-containing protein n=1 Tax=Kribbella sp. CA-294648 TaxID=3239948 RepID=UPI003D941E69